MTTQRTAKDAGLALRAARLHRDLRQAELARILGVERTQIARYETGNEPVPRSLVEQYAGALGITPQAFQDMAVLWPNSDEEEAR